MRLVHGTACCILLGLFAGCVMHVPMSEMAMYTKQRVPTTRPTGFGLNYATSLVGADHVEALAGRRFRGGPGIDRVDIDPVNVQKRGGSVSLLVLSKSRRTGYGVSAGASTGIDMPVPVGQRWYVTGLLSGGGGELVVQHPFSGSLPLGASMGLFARRERYDFYVTKFYDDGEQPSCTLCGPDERIWMSLVGLRGGIMVFDAHKSSFFLRGVLHAGYAFEVDAPVVHLGISLGAF